MSSNYLPDPLPESEWNFSQYKSEFEITQAFYYEYCRSCEAIHPWIVGGRHFWGSPVPVSESERLEMESKDYFEAIQELPGASYFEFLSITPEFPDKALSECADLGTRFKFYGQHTSPQPLKSYDISFFSWEIFKPEAFKPVTPDCYNNPFYGRRGYGLPVLAFLGINWGCTDKELLEEFAVFLKANRPERFAGLRHPLQRGLGNRILPFQKDTALGWLSVWRRKEKAMITWDQYIALYAPEYDNPTKVEHEKRDSLLRRLKKENQNAKKVIDWFSGKSVDF